MEEEMDQFEDQLKLLEMSKVLQQQEQAQSFFNIESDAEKMTRVQNAFGLRQKIRSDTVTESGFYVVEKEKVEQAFPENKIKAKDEVEMGEEMFDPSNLLEMSKNLQEQEQQSQ